jgi:copper chaperone CopZ
MVRTIGSYMDGRVNQEISWQPYGGWKKMNDYFHVVPGRVRIRSRLVKADERAAGTIRAALQNLPGVESVSVSTLTGSVTVLFNPRQMDASSVLNRLSNAGYFKPGQAVSSTQYLDSAASQLGQKVGKALLGVAVDRVLGGTPLSFIAALI